LPTPAWQLKVVEKGKGGARAGASKGSRLYVYFAATHFIIWAAPFTAKSQLGAKSLHLTTLVTTRRSKKCRHSHFKLSRKAV
jgi:hypothetical protein